MMTREPAVIYGMDGEPIQAEQFDDKVRVHRPPKYIKPRGRTGLSQCTSRLCTEPAVLDRNVHNVGKADGWRALCREHALDHADRLGESLGALVRRMIS